MSTKNTSYSEASQCLDLVTSKTPSMPFCFNFATTRFSDWTLVSFHKLTNDNNHIMQIL